MVPLIGEPLVVFQHRRNLLGKAVEGRWVEPREIAHQAELILAALSLIIGNGLYQ